ncbi:MAG: hypothetical protein WAO19_02935 [Candidatus Kryptoniota bacterium]
MKVGEVRCVLRADYRPLRGGRPAKRTDDAAISIMADGRRAFYVRIVDKWKMRLPRFARKGEFVAYYPSSDNTSHEGNRKETDDRIS